jgi:hypothetical protein
MSGLDEYRLMSKAKGCRNPFKELLGIAHEIIGLAHAHHRYANLSLRTLTSRGGEKRRPLSELHGNFG